jgi:hypothetical protein
MKKLISFLFALSILITFNSCKVKDGEPGPAGENSLYKQGSVSGTFYYKYSNGDTAIIPFNHEYYESMNYNTFLYDSINYNDYAIDFYRSQLKETDSYLYFNSQGFIDADNKFEIPTNNYIEFNLINKYKNVVYNWSLDAYSNQITITDFKMDPKTGNVTYNYTIDIPASDLNFRNKVDDVTPLIIKGSVNVVLDEDEYSGCLNC